LEIKPAADMALLPHSEQCRVASIDEVNDPDAGLGSVLPVQAAGVLLRFLLRRAFPPFITDPIAEVVADVADGIQARYQCGRQS